MAHNITLSATASDLANVPQQGSSDDSSAVTISTTLNQCLLSGGGGGSTLGGTTVTIGSGKQGGGSSTVVPAGAAGSAPTKHTVPSGSWVHHHGIVYAPLDTQPPNTTSSVWSLELGERVGSWMTINEGLDPTEYNHTVRLPVFLLSASHGPSPTGVDFGYAVLPGVAAGAGSAAGAVTAFHAANKVVRNDRDAMAVFSRQHGQPAAAGGEEEVLLIATWPGSGTITVDAGAAAAGGGSSATGGWKVTIEGAATSTSGAGATTLDGGLLQLHSTTSAAISSAPRKTVFSIAAANPRNAAGVLTFTINRKLASLRSSDQQGGNGVGSAVSCVAAGTAGTRVTVTLPDGEDAGKTVEGAC